MGTAEALGGFFQNQPCDAFRIREHIIVPHTQNAPAFRFEKCRSAVVIALPFKMLAAVELDSEPRFAACQIDNIISDDELPREGRSITRKKPPNDPLRRCRLIP